MPNNKISDETKAVQSMVCKGSKDWAAFGVFIAELEEHLGFLQGVALRGYTVTRKGHQWLLVLRVTKAGVNKVAFFQSDTVVMLYRQVYKMVYTTNVHWHKDKY